MAEGEHVRASPDAEVTAERLEGTSSPHSVLRGIPVFNNATAAVIGDAANVVEAELGIVVDLPRTEKETALLTYRVAVTCFSSVDVTVTVLTTLVLLEWRFYGFIALLFVIGPVCGILGSQLLNLPLSLVYWVFCFAKVAYEVYAAVRTVNAWCIAFAVVQLWITKIVYTYCKALINVNPKRRAELARQQDSPVGVVVW
eukprot:TRINITY_DN42099_c0_g1_i1.p1 TRINITY_DN42099_c0_g1~~TRINITY_DN42099_c0_g1_i1.p1  ORF type:complete len:199 (+),score=38.22 TRINITY_DN42099_c0_g1_i1:82-678(+)